ncbi:restriction endonuclease subunit S [bacterium]|nr:restriction endonuclease subunit S [bacterium]
MGEWRKCRLDEIADVVDCEHKTALKVENSVYLSIRTSDILNGKIDFNNANRVSLETFKEWTRRAIPQEGDIILAREAPVGEVGYIKKNYHVCLGQRTVMISVKDANVEKQYLLYYLVSPATKNDLKSRSTGSVVQHLNMKDIRAFEVRHPTLQEQKAIASVLSSLDDKIDLLHCQNNVLEAMAETLFRQWFVEEAEEDWEEVCLGDVADINPTYTLKKGIGSSYLEMRNVSSSGFYPTSWYSREFTSGMKFQNGDTLLARITPCLENGKTCFVTFLDDKEIGWGSTEYIVIRMKKPYHPFLSYVIARSEDFREFAISSMTGSSGRQRAQANMISDFHLFAPPAQVIDKINIQMECILAKLKNNAIQVSTLENMRDLLLPKLMSGEVDVRV